jgi:hypothetical protein
MADTDEDIDEARRRGSQAPIDAGRPIADDKMKDQKRIFFIFIYKF